MADADAFKDFEDTENFLSRYLDASCDPCFEKTSLKSINLWYTFKYLFQNSLHNSIKDITAQSLCAGEMGIGLNRFKMNALEALLRDNDKGLFSVHILRKTIHPRLRNICTAPK